jgi:pilus assembly protein CpaE
VVAVMSGKGGSGKTITATNLATAMTMDLGPGRVAIVDADLQFGDVALLLQLDPERTLADLAGSIDSLTADRLEQALLPHESGLDVLAAPVTPAASDGVTPKAVVRMAEILTATRDVVVVDTAPIFDDDLIFLLGHAHRVVVVVDMDLPSVKNAKIAFDTLRLSGFPMERIRLVVNRVDSKARLDLVELERSLGHEVFGTIPSDRLIPQSVNEGIPAVALGRRTRVARSFHRLAEALRKDLGIKRRVS